MLNYSLDRGKGHYLVTTEGRRLFDLINGFGSVFLGHCDDAIAAAAHDQIDRLWTAARLPTINATQVYATLGEMLDFRLSNLFLYSTGMESLEFSLRLSASRTGRKRFIGFSNSMYGKSIATSNLGWDNSPIPGDNFIRLPFPTQQNQQQVLNLLGQQLDSDQIAAVLLEPLQGSWQGELVPDTFAHQSYELCQKHDTLFVLDETLTGLYRTGPRFYSDSFALTPDILVFAKSIGNGFPVSVVATNVSDEYVSASLPGSTFSGSPLACRMVNETLQQMQLRINSGQIESIAEVVTSTFENTASSDFRISGSGALWVLSLDSQDRAEYLQKLAYENDILISCFGSRIRLLPQAEVDLNKLEETCRLLAKAL